jgi:hypothetical protein
MKKEGMFEDILVERFPPWYRRWYRMWIAFRDEYYNQKN